MTDFAQKLRHALWWLVPLVAIAVAIVLEAQLGRGMNPQPPAEVPIEPKPVVTALLPEFTIDGGVAARTDTVARTLFNPTRRPAPAGADKGIGRMQRGQFTLAGTLLLDGSNTAYLKESSSGKQRRVRQGEQINGMTVAEVKPDRVRLTLGDEAEDLTLKVATNPRPTPTTVATTPAGTPMPVPMPVTAAAAAAAARPANESEELARRRAAARASAAAAAAANPATPAQGAATAAGATAPDQGWADIAKAYQDRPTNTRPPRNK